MVSNKDISKILEDRRKGIKSEKPPESPKTPNTSSTGNKCDSCGFENPSEAKFCVKCGNVLKQEPAPPGEKPKIDHKICPNCHTQNKLEAKFCVACGQKFEEIEEPAREVESEETATITETDEVIIEEEEEIEEVEEISETDKNELPEVRQVSLVKTEETVKEEVVEEEIEEKEPPAKSRNVDPVEKIKKAKELLDMGAISQEEFNKIKEKYLKLI